jgi:hypothetical protein
VAKTVDPFAKAIHDLCVAAGAKCGPKCGASKGTRSRRRNLTVAEAEQMMWRAHA